MNADNDCRSAEEVATNELLACQALLMARYRPTFHDELVAAAEKNVPMRYFDDERYRKQENTLNMDARAEPSLLRFHSLCCALQSGFRAASRPPVDTRLGETTWLSACLELLAENPLKNSHNDWKQTLTLQDRNAILARFDKMYGAMTEWVEAVRGLEPMSDAEDWGGLVAAIWQQYVEPYAKLSPRGYSASPCEAMILAVDAYGNLHVNDRPLRALSRACSVLDAAAKYREGECPAECFGRVAMLDLAWDFNHEARCMEYQGLCRLSNEFLLKRINLYNAATDNPMRRSVLVLADDANRLYDYYLREYCTPTPYHNARASREEIDEKAVNDMLEAVDYNIASLCDAIYRDSNHSAKAVEMHNAWGEIRGLFATRCVSSAMPSYSQQVAFAEKLSRFMELFNAALPDINVPPKARGPEVAEAVTEKAKDSDLSSKGQCPFGEKKLKVAPRLRDFIKDVDFEKQKIYFKDREQMSKRALMEITKTEKNKLWQLLVRLMTETKDDGWVTLKEGEENWHGYFRRTVKGDRTRKIVDPQADAVILGFHVFSDKKPGDTGVAKIRLEKRYQEDKFRKRLALYRAWKKTQGKTASDK